MTAAAPSAPSRCSAAPSCRGGPPTSWPRPGGWASTSVKEIFLVSENSTSYGKDLGDLRLLETMLPELAAVEGIERVRVSYLQPAEIRMGLLDVMASTPGVVPYFDISFQHASEPLLRRMRRFGSAQGFLDLIDQVRARAPLAGIRSNVIVGFPGETEEDLVELEGFLTAARLDVVGVFGYSDEDGTEAETYAGQAREPCHRRAPCPCHDARGGAQHPAGRGSGRRTCRGPGRGDRPGYRRADRTGRASGARTSTAPRSWGCARAPGRRPWARSSQRGLSRPRA